MERVKVKERELVRIRVRPRNCLRASEFAALRPGDRMAGRKLISGKVFVVVEASCNGILPVWGREEVVEDGRVYMMAGLSGLRPVSRVEISHVMDTVRRVRLEHPHRKVGTLEQRKQLRRLIRGMMLPEHRTEVLNRSNLEWMLGLQSGMCTYNSEHPNYRAAKQLIGEILNREHNGQT